MGLAAALNPALTTSDVEESRSTSRRTGEATATLTNPLVDREETIELVKRREWRIASLRPVPS